jgi:transcriptional regulator with XRE-family HTH domain
MDYAALLDRLLKNASERGISANNVCKRCTEQGISDVTPTYLSQIRNRKKEPPSDKVSKALAMALDVHEDLLIIQAYIDKSPQEFKQLISELRRISDLTTQEFFSRFPAIGMDNVIAFHEEMSDAEYLLHFFEQQRKSLEFINKGVHPNNVMQLEIEIPQIPNFDVIDEAMAPLIPKGSKVTISTQPIESIKNDDIVLCLINAELTQTIAKIFFKNKRQRVTLVYNNPAYKSRSFGIDEISILGKVTQVTSFF